jgi:uncharacterized delta-60 repeat protein
VRRVVLMVVAALLIAALLMAVEPAWAHDSGFGIARYMPDGALDQSFGNSGVVVTRSAQRSFVANALALQPDAKIVIAGMSGDVSNGAVQVALARYTPDGAEDQTFGTGGFAATPVGSAGAQANAVALQPDGMVLVAGTAFAHGTGDDSFFVARYSPAGALDATFGTAGMTTTHVGAAASSASAIALQADGRIIVVGTAYSNGATDDDFAAVRYKSSGDLDESFGSGGIVTTDFSARDPAAGTSLDRAGAATLQPDGKVVVAGFTRGERQTFAVARYSPDGSLDASFGAGGKVQVPAAEPQVFSIALQASGDLVLAGSSASSQGGTSPFTLMRFHADGRPDERFGTDGIVMTAVEGSRSGARALIAQPDGRLIAGGAKFGAPSAQGDPSPDSGFALTRYTPGGDIDSSFGSGGRALTTMGDAGATPVSLALQPDGKIVAAGLVFFQVASAQAPPGQDLRLRLEALGAGIAVVLGMLAIVLTVRRSKK